MRYLLSLGLLSWSSVARGETVSVPVTASFINLERSPGVYVTPTDNVWRIGGDTMVNVTLDNPLASPTLKLAAAGLRSATITSTASGPGTKGPQELTLTVNYE